MFQDLRRHSIETGFLADLRRGSNSLNSNSGEKNREVIRFAIKIELNEQSKDKDLMFDK